MRALNYLEAVMAFIMLSLITSCTAPKKMSLSCPEPVRKYPGKTVGHHRKAKDFIAFFQKDNSQRSLSFRYTSNSQSVRSTKHTQNTDIKHITSPTTETTTSDKTNYINNLYASASISASQATYKGYSLGLSNYETAGNLDDGSAREKTVAIPVYSDTSPETTFRRVTDAFFNPVFVVPVEILLQDSTETNTQPTATGGFTFSLAGIIAFIAGILTLNLSLLTIFPVLCGVAGSVLSGIALNRIKRNPSMYKGKGLAKAGMIVGIVGFILGVLMFLADRFIYIG